MLTLKTTEKEEFDEDTLRFRKIGKDFILQLEHSLISLSKWESIWKKPFLDGKPKTREETISYIQCMTITQNVPSEVYDSISDADIQTVNNYIDEPMTATWFNDKNKKGNAGGTGEMVTAELIYYWMISYQVPVEFQKWHLNKLLTLIRVCNVKSNTKDNKMSQKDILQQNAELNRIRRAKNKK